jgi:hypothetical protein
VTPDVVEVKHKDKKHKKRRSDSESDDDDDDDGGNDDGHHDSESDNDEDNDSNDNDSSSSDSYARVKKEPKASSSKVKKKKKKSRRSENEEYSSSRSMKSERYDLYDTKDPVVKLHESGQNQIDYIEAQYLCLTCDKSCKNYAMLIKHRQVHPNKGGVIVKRNCNICEEHQIPQNLFEQHCMDKHPDYKPQKCLLCPAHFVGHKSLKEHLRKHLVPEKFQCLYCGSYHSK